uniref:Ribonuclease H-like domain-containing protein n=1 Tax=Tanacetum cinerariifolium TaxID=118510 RepID=A0A699GYS5_TANCI|nr:ribonuclease H-like domain-containing protein [Tanacetum cinerariifolium]
MGMETKMSNLRLCFSNYKCINDPKKSNPQHALKDKRVIDSGCSRHMIGNISNLSKFKDLNGGYVAFGGNPKGGKISRKGKIKTGKLDFNDVYFVNVLKFNLFCVSQMCDKKNSVLFTNTKCLVLSPEFKLPDENQVLLRVPRKNNVYNVDLKNIVPSGALTCLFTKATLDESNLWHRRLGHINFKKMNKLFNGNLVRRLPSKVFENDNTFVACKKGKQHKDQAYAAFDEKEPEFKARKPESKVNVSPSSSAQNKKHDDKTKREAKGKSPVESITGYRNLSAEFEDFTDNSINEEEVYVYQPPGFEDPDYPDMVYKVVKELYGLHQDLIAWLQALVDKKKVDVTEPTIRDALQLDDTEGVKCLPNEEIFTELARMRYEKPSTKLTFYKAFFSSQWKFLIHTILQCMSAKRTSWNEFSSSMSSACLQIGKGFSRVDTPLFEGMLVAQEVGKSDADEVHAEDVNAAGVTKCDASVADDEVNAIVDEPSIPSPTPPTLPPQPSQDKPSTSYVLSMHEEESKPAKLQEVVDVVTTAKIITKVITAASDTITAASTTIIAVNAQVLAAIIIVAPSRLTTASGRRKGVKAQIEQDEAYARELVVEMNKNIDWDEVIDHVHKKAKEDNVVKRYQALKRKPQTKAQARKNMMIYLKNVASFKMDYFKRMSYDDIQRKYPLTKFTLSQMINNVRLKVNEESKVSLEFLRFTRQQQQEVNAARHFITAVSYELMLFGLTKDVDVNLMMLAPKNTMAPLTSADTHDMVAFLSKSDASEIFDQITDFLNAYTIKYALVVNPTIYVSCIKQFWATAIVKKVNDNVQLRALINGKKVVVSEAIIRRDLHLDDADGVECLPNEEIFKELSRMGYENPLPKQTFYKAFFSAQWKFFIHILVQCLSAKRTAWNEFSYSIASVFICLATGKKFNFSKYIFDNMVRNVDSPSKFLMYPRFLQVVMDNQVDDMTTHNTRYTSLALIQKVDEIEKDKHSQALEILQLKTRVKKLERKRKSKSPGLKRIRMEGKIEAIDADEDITLVDVESNEEIVAIDAESQGARDKQEKADMERALELQRQYDDKEENIDWSVVAKQVQEIHLDSIKKYQNLKKKPVSIAQDRKNMIIYLKNMAGYKMEFFKVMTYDKESFKKLREAKVSGSESTQEIPSNDPKEMSEEDIQNMLEIVPVLEFKVEALQVKYPIIDWEIHTEGSRVYRKIIRVGGITEAYKIFEDMLKGFDKEDLVALWNLVKEKFSSAVHSKDKEKALQVELKSDYGVHHVSLTRGHDIFMLTEKDYPLSNVVMILMLSGKLQVEEDNEMARDLVMKIFIKANKPKSRSLDTSSK